MKIQTIEFGFRHDDSVFVSDIVNVYDSKDGLKIQIETVSEDGFRGVLTVFFDDVRGYRFLDEGGLYYCFSSGAFAKPFHIYKIVSGGWVSGEVSQPDLLQVSKAVNCQEWFVVTNNGCINVLSNCQPSTDWQRAQQVIQRDRATHGPLTPALCKTEKIKTQGQSRIRLIFGFVKIQFRGLFFEVVISVGGF